MECVYCAVRAGYLNTTPRSLHTLYLCVSCGSQNKQPLFPYTKLTDWFLGTFAKKKNHVCLSVRAEQLGPTGRIFIQFDIWVFFENLPRKFKFQYNMTRITGPLHENLLAFISPWILRMWNVSDKSCTENQNPHFVFSGFFSPFRIRAVYEIMWKTVVERGRPKMAIWRMRIACWIPKATNTHSEYVILIAFPLQQWLQERASMLRYTYTACIVITATEFVYCAVRNEPLTLRLPD